MLNYSTTLSPHEFFLTETEDLCGPEAFEALFQNACAITNGIIDYKKITIKEKVDNRMQAFRVAIRHVQQTTTIDLEMPQEHHFNMALLAQLLNQKLWKLGYNGHRYFYDIGMEAGIGGLAFTEFDKEYELHQQGYIWRGRSEFENAEGYEHFWERFNEKTREVEPVVFIQEAPRRAKILQQYAKKNEIYFQKKALEKNKRKRWWQFW